MFQPLVLALLLLGLAGAVSAAAPEERLLGQAVGLVYLHGAWVWTSIVALASAAISGLVGLLRRSNRLHAWSLALGQTGTFFWVTYLPISMWTMQATWGGLYLAEPRWRLGVSFAVAAVLVQAAILLIGRPTWASVLNVLTFGVLAFSLSRTASVMHPASPVFGSGAAAIIAVFLVIQFCCVGAAAMIAYALHQRRS
ncbi:MAG TPA: hypothetical protein VFI11_03690 [Anaerolineales bacterium]|nr:hypothetical protein [Anaerolineales bacterium]